VLSISNPNDYEIIINNSNLLQKEGSDIYGSSSISFKLKFANQWNQVPVITIRTKGANSQVIKSFPFYFIASLKDVAPFQNQSLTVPLCTNQDINLI
jgi:hypothetical protein